MASPPNPYVINIAARRKPSSGNTSGSRMKKALLWQNQFHVRQPVAPVEHETRLNGGKHLKGCRLAFYARIAELIGENMRILIW
jgi:hypothetical protein